METLSTVTNRLQKEGYNSEIILSEIKDLVPDEWLIDKIHRFEGMSSAGDSSIVYALSKKDGTRKSLLINAYGVYNDADISNFITRVAVRPE